MSEQSKRFSGFMFGKRFKKLLKNTDENELMKSLGIASTSTFRQWTNGYTLPTGENLYKLSKYFNVSTDYLLGLSDVKTTDRDVKAMREYTGLSEKAVEALHKSKQSQVGRLAPGELSGITSLLVEDSEGFDQTTINEYDSTHSDVLRYMGLFLYNSRFLVDMFKDENDVPNSEYIEWLEEMSEGANMATLQKSLWGLKKRLDIKRETEG